MTTIAHVLYALVSVAVMLCASTIYNSQIIYTILKYAFEIHIVGLSLLFLGPQE